MGVADHLPDEPVGLGKTDHGEGVVLVALRHIDGHVFIEPVVAAGDIGHPAEGLEDGVAVLADEEFVQLLGGVGGGAVVVVLGGGGRPQKQAGRGEQGGMEFHPRLSSELCGKAPASP